MRDTPLTAGCLTANDRGTPASSNQSQARDRSNAALHHLACVETWRYPAERLDGEGGVPVAEPIAVIRAGQPCRSGYTARPGEFVKAEQPLVHPPRDRRAERGGDRLHNLARPGESGRSRVEPDQRVDHLGPFGSDHPGVNVTAV